MIQEAYCSFEVAKLLNEKGFEAYTHMVYKLPCQLFHIDKECLVRNYDGITEEDSTAILAPTHQMAMAWLREKFIFIVIDDDVPLISYKYTIKKYNINELYEVEVLRLDSLPFIEYEEAVEAALKYVLENLL